MNNVREGALRERMNLETGYEGRRARIEIVPLIDVVFLLLVFFVYAMLSMTVYHGIRVSVPAGEGAVEEETGLTINIADDNTLWFNGRQMGMSETVDAVARDAGDGDVVLVSGDRAADLGVAVELLSGLRHARITEVSFQVKTGGNEADR